MAADCSLYYPVDSLHPFLIVEVMALITLSKSSLHPHVQYVHTGSFFFFVFFFKCFDFPLPARRCVQCRHSLSALGQPPGRNSGMLTEHSSVCAASQARPRFCVESTCIQLQLFPKTDCLLMLSDLTENMAASARLFDRTSIKQCQGGVVIYDLMSGWLYDV